MELRIKMYGEWLEYVDSLKSVLCGLFHSLLLFLTLQTLGLSLSIFIKNQLWIQLVFVYTHFSHCFCCVVCLKKWYFSQGDLTSREQTGLAAWCCLWPWQGSQKLLRSYLCYFLVVFSGVFLGSFRHFRQKCICEGISFTHFVLIQNGNKNQKQEKRDERKEKKDCVGGKDQGQSIHFRVLSLFSKNKIKGFSTVYQIPSSAFKWEAMFVGGFNPSPFSLLFSWTFFIMKYRIVRGFTFKKQEETPNSWGLL